MSRLFSVTPGIDRDAARETASCYLGIAESLVRAIGAMDADQVRTNIGSVLDLRDLAWAAAHLVEFAKALVDDAEVQS